MVGRWMVMATLLLGCGADCPEPITPAPVQPATAAEPEAEPPVRQEETAMARMDLETMDRQLQSLGSDVRRRGGIWELTVDDVEVAVITDTNADRMRIVAPVVAVADMTAEQHASILAANFHTALDARYAASRGVLYSAFIHRLSTLHPADLESGLRQVVNLVKTFGSSYNSGELIFGG